jgi:hypothetical protein
MNRPYQVKKKGLPASNRHAAVRQTKNADHKPGKKKQTESAFINSRAFCR